MSSLTTALLILTILGIIGGFVLGYTFLTGNSILDIDLISKEILPTNETNSEIP